MVINQIDNFFERVDIIYNEAKKIKLYSNKEHPEYQGIQTSTWPGLRSKELSFCNPILKYLCIKFFMINNFLSSNSSIEVFIHSRQKGDENKDFIHQDITSKFSLLIYLSPTNLDSGTRFFNDENKIINDIKFVQNRLIFFDGRYKHSAYGHHGDNINNSRITLNAFIT